MRTRLIFVPLLLVLGCARSTATQPKSSDSSGELRHARIGIQTAAGARYALDVEVADTNESRERGLMYRRHMADDAGMIFLFDTEREQTFWMKNTFIALDMIFIGANNRIVGIVPEATPETESVRTVGVPSRYVLEVNGGWAALKGVRTGDRVELSEALPAGG